LSLFPEPVLVEQWLISPEIFFEADLDREYGVLLRQEFEQQRSQLRLRCRTFMIDLVMQSREPKRGHPQ
jgi:hypothetical protein